MTREGVFSYGNIKSADHYRSAVDLIVYRSGPCERRDPEIAETPELLSKE